MSRMRRILEFTVAVPLTGALVVLTEVLRAAHRADLPSFPNQDPSGTFGDPGLPSLRIVAVGDSSLTAPGVRNLDNIWIRRIARHWEDRYHVELISLGVGGSKVRDVVEGQLEEAVRLRPDIAVVSVCTNDAMRATPRASFSADLDLILTRLEAVAPAVVVLGMGDPGSAPRLPALIRPWVSRRGRIFDDLTIRVCTTHPQAIKVDTRGRMSSAFWEDPSHFAPDLFHAGDTGHGVFAAGALPALEAALAMWEASQRA